MALLASSALALEVRSAATESVYAQAGNPFLGGPIVPVIPEDPSGGPTPSAVGGGPIPVPPGSPGDPPNTPTYAQIDVIAGTVLPFANMGILGDRDRNPWGGLTDLDVWWNQQISVNGGQVLETTYDPLGQTPTSSIASILWQAPTTECTLTVTRTALDYRSTNEYEGTSDLLPVVSHQTIKVHQLALTQLSGGLAMVHNWIESAPAWHCLDDWTAKECDGWGNSAFPVDVVKWTRAGGPQAPMLFAGQQPATVGVGLEDALGDVVTALVPTSIRLHAAWPEEGAEFSAVLTVTHLPLVGEVAVVSGSLDAAVNWYPAVTWDWRHDTNWGSVEYLVEDVDVAVDATIPGVGTSHAGIKLGLSEATPKRVESVYSAMDGMSTELDIARAAAVWAHGVGNDLGLSWRNFANETPPKPVRMPAHTEDVWCIWCLHAADCFTQALLASSACQLAGVAADAAVAYPRRAWGDNWNDADTCYASLSDPYWAALGHDAHKVWFNAGAGGNQFEGYFTAAERFWTCDPPPGTGPLCAPVDGWDSLPQMVTTIAVHPFGWQGMEDEGWLCVWQVTQLERMWSCHGNTKTDDNGTVHHHLIPEPTPPGP